MLAHPVVVVDLAHVAGTVVVEQHDSEVRGLQLVLELAQPLKSRPAAVAEKEALLAGEFPGGEGSVLVGDLLEFVDDVKVHIGRQDVLADALGDVGVDLIVIELPCLVVLLEDRAIGINTPYLNVGIFFFEILGST